MKRWRYQLLRMSHNNYVLKEGAFLISDAHYSSKRPELLQLLKSIEAEELKTPQIVFMGDVFDLLFGHIPITKERNRDAVNTINALAKKIELIYLEGNHDFVLHKIFPDIHVISIEHQPLKCMYGDKKLSLAHGDYRGDWKYRLYLHVIRSPLILKFLNVIDTLTSHGIIRWLDAYLDKKNDCAVIEAFKKRMMRHRTLFESYDCDYVIEGHFHQNCTIDFEEFEYINLGAFACNQRYFIVQSSEKQKLLREVFFNKEII
ncbi:MAG: metallophosphoesterase [Campylobacterota bacterium]|nr:metallophosphoesterase [Campylobacterota bacterium]